MLHWELRLAWEAQTCKESALLTALCLSFRTEDWGSSRGEWGKVGSPDRDNFNKFGRTSMRVQLLEIRILRVWQYSPRCRVQVVTGSAVCLANYCTPFRTAHCIFRLPTTAWDAAVTPTEKPVDSGASPPMGVRVPPQALVPRHSQPSRHTRSSAAKFINWS